MNFLFPNGGSWRHEPRLRMVVRGDTNQGYDEKGLDELEANAQVIFYYCDEKGNKTSAVNPNNATRKIAGICNANRNFFGMMPHPERACSPVMGNIDGQEMIRTLLMAEQFVG